MKQSKWASMAESMISTAVGFGISLVAQIVFLPMLGVTVTLSQNITFAIIMTVISIARGYILRRVFEHFGIRSKLSPFVHAVIAERKRQIEVEGWDTLHDDTEHAPGALAHAGSAYARTAHVHLDPETAVAIARNPRLFLPNAWPWASEWFKPTGFRRDLVKACALIVAEGEKFDRNRKRKSAQKEAA